MKKTIGTLILFSAALIGSSAFILKNATGIQGYAGSPNESTCSYCHSGGTSSSSGCTISAVPNFTPNSSSLLEYLPDTLYTITIQAQASGFSKFGFASQILDNNDVNSGNLQNPGSGVKFLNAGTKRTAVHSTPKNAAATGIVTFTYKWKAPAAGSGDATIYAIANAVNGNNSYYGDFVIQPVNMPLVEGTPPPPIDLVGIKENQLNVSQVTVFPNPAGDLTRISYYLAQPAKINIDLIDIRGEVLRQLYQENSSPGVHSQILNLQGISPGVYFIRTSANNQRVSQKLITVQ